MSLFQLSSLHVFKGLGWILITSSDWVIEKGQQCYPIPKYPITQTQSIFLENEINLFQKWFFSSTKDWSRDPQYRWLVRDSTIELSRLVKRILIKWSIWANIAFWLRKKIHVLCLGLNSRPLLNRISSPSFYHWAIKTFMKELSKKVVYLLLFQKTSLFSLFSKMFTTYTHPPPYYSIPFFINCTKLWAIDRVQYSLV